MHEGAREIDYTDKGMERKVTKGTKDVKPDCVEFQEQVAQVSQSVDDVTRATAFHAFTSHAENEGMESLISVSSSAAQTFWNAKLVQEGQTVGESSEVSQTPQSAQPSPMKSGKHAFAPALSKDDGQEEEFDWQASTTVARMNIDRSFKILVKDVVATLKLAGTFLSTVKDESFFPEIGLQTLRLRFEGLQAVSAGIKLEEFRSRWVTQGGTDKADEELTSQNAPPPMAIDKIAPLKTLDEIKDFGLNVGSEVTSNDDSQKEVKIREDDVAAPVVFGCKGVKCMVELLSDQRKKMEKDILAMEKAKHRAVAKANSSMANVKAIVKGKGDSKGVGKNSDASATFGIFTVDWNNCASFHLRSADSPVD